MQSKDPRTSACPHSTAHTPLCPQCYRLQFTVVEMVEFRRRHRRWRWRSQQPPHYAPSPRAAFSFVAIAKPPPRGTVSVSAAVLPFFARPVPTPIKHCMPCLLLCYVTFDQKKIHPPDCLLSLAQTCHARLRVFVHPHTL